MFGDKTARPPLKVGIAQDLDRARGGVLPADLALADIKAFLRVWTQAPAYWRAMSAGAARIALTGEPHGFVSYLEAAKARKARAAFEENQKRRQENLSNRKKADTVSRSDQLCPPCPGPAASTD